MDNFVVSARKYRPITFDLVVGQQSITSTLKSAIKNNHLAQAFLFTGPRGVGKTTCARIFAKTINCSNLNDKMEPCDKCESCVSFNQNNSFNIHELDAASNNSVEDIRRLVDQVRIPPQVGDYKVYIIDEGHMLSQAAFNAFLKTLEEPPAYAKFILATTEKHKIIPTILSRCQIYDFNRITLKDIANYISYVAKNEGVTVEEEALLVMAQKADGAMRDALSIFDQLVSYAGKNITYKDTIDNLNVLDVEYYFKLVDLMLVGDISSSLMVLNDIISNGFDGLHFINGLATHLRNLLVSQDTKTISLLETSESIKSHYLEQTKKCNLRFLVFAIDLCTNVDLNYKITTDKRLLIELNLMKMCKLNNPFTQVGTTALPEVKKKVEVKTNTSQNIVSKPAIESAKIVKPKPVEQKSPEKKVEQINKIEEKLIENSKEKTPIIVNDNQEASSKPKLKRSSRTRGISIKQGLSEIKVEEKKISLEEELNVKFDTVEKEISKEEFYSAVEKYISNISKEKPAFASAIERKNLEILPNNTLHINIVNNAMNDKELKYNFLLFLKEELDNKQIQLSTKVIEVEQKLKETSMDIYNKMNSKNPNLDKLRKQLDLDFMS